MRVTCPNCRREIIPLKERGPSGKVLAARCPHCRTDLNITPKGVGSPSPSKVVGERSLDPTVGASGIALCCPADPRTGGRLRNILETMGYQTVHPAFPEDGVERMRHLPVSLVLYQEGFDSDPSGGLWAYLCSLSGRERRGIIVVWLGKGIATGDPMLAFSKSANLVLDERDLKRLPDLLEKVREAHEKLYRPINTVMEELGMEAL